jgi:hypothetical protein
MRMFATTAAIMAALTVSAFAEGEPTGTEAQGEANGSFRMSAQEPPITIFRGSGLALAQDSLETTSIGSSRTSASGRLEASSANATASSAELKAASGKSRTSAKLKGSSASASGKLKGSGASAQASGAEQANAPGEKSKGEDQFVKNSPSGMDGGNRK